MTYPLINGEEINGATDTASSSAGQLYAASVPEATAHGTAVAVAGLNSQTIVIAREGSALAQHGAHWLIRATPSGTNLAVSAASLGPTVVHGAPTAKGSATVQARGLDPTTSHGEARATLVSVVRAAGSCTTLHATARAVAAARAAGAAETSHGRASAVAVLHASGGLVSRIGIPSIASAAIGLSALGGTETRHGISRVGSTGVRAFPGSTGARHGKPTLLRSTPC